MIELGKYASARGGTFAKLLERAEIAQRFERQEVANARRDMDVKRPVSKA